MNPTTFNDVVIYGVDVSAVAPVSVQPTSGSSVITTDVTLTGFFGNDDAGNMVNFVSEGQTCADADASNDVALVVAADAMTATATVSLDNDGASFTPGASSGVCRPRADRSSSIWLTRAYIMRIGSKAKRH